MVFVDKELVVSKQEEGVNRDPILVRYLDQPVTTARYIGKRYRKSKFAQIPLMYIRDVLTHETARHYLGLFNKALLDAYADFHEKLIMVPVVHARILSAFRYNTVMQPGDDSDDTILDFMNIEPFIEGKFTKISNNNRYINKKVNKDTMDLAMAFSHFTWCESEGRLIVNDLQGWSRDGTTILTDPCIITYNYCMGNVDCGKEGIQNFWTFQHVQCNDICHKLRLYRPRRHGDGGQGDIQTTRL